MIILLQCSGHDSEPSDLTATERATEVAKISRNAHSRSSPPAEDDAAAVVGTAVRPAVRGGGQSARRPVATAANATTDGGGSRVMYMPAYVIPDGSPVDPCVTCRPRRTTPCQKRPNPCQDAVPQATKRCSCPPAAVATKTPRRTTASGRNRRALRPREMATSGVGFRDPNNSRPIRSEKSVRYKKITEFYRMFPSECFTDLSGLSVYYTLPTQI